MLDKHGQNSGDKGHRPPFHKRKYLINPRLQWELILFFYGACAVTVGVLYFGIRRMLADLESRCVLFASFPEDSCTEVVRMQQGTINTMFILSIIVATVVSVGGGIFFSNRIAGPLYRLGLHLKQMAAGKPHKILLRKNDYFQEIIDIYNNELLDKFRSKE